MFWLVLCILSLGAVGSLLCLTRAVLPNLGSLRQPELLLDVWLPIAFVIPLLGSLVGIESAIRGAGWLALGGPVIAVAGGIGLALTIGRPGLGAFGEEIADGEAIGWSLSARLIGASVLAGLVFLLLGAAHLMTIWIGQVAFALAAVLLWINTPDHDPREASDHAPISAGLGMIGMLASGLLMAIGVALTDPESAVPAYGLVLAHMLCSLALIARLGTAGLALRIGLWIGSVGVLFALGFIAFRHLLPHLVAAITNEDIGRQFVIAYGFGAYAFEAACLLALPVLLLVAMRLPSQPRRVFGGVVFLAAIGLAVWRLGGLV